VTKTPLRKLAVLLHADVVDSTSLVRINETIAHERIQDAFHRLSLAIGNYDGIAHEIRGDALVAEFPRASDAVSASIAFQTANTTHNEQLSGDIRPLLRIGIAMGEVVVADNTVTGEGIVLAQRLEQLAETGGVVVQGSVSETVPTRLPFEFISLGEHTLKGFDHPVRAFAVQLKHGGQIPVSESSAVVSEFGTRGNHERPPLELPEKPSIAVLPFSNMSNEPEQEYFADGIAEDIITALSRLNWLFVIARHSSFAYKNRSVDIRQIANDLGVRYVLEGSVRKGGNKVRISCQLIDASNGSHIWADRFDGTLEDVFDLQDQVTFNVVGAIEPKLRAAEIERSRRKRPENLQAYDLLLQALPHLYTFRPEANAKAVQLLEQAADIDPDYAPVLANLAWCLEQRFVHHWPEAREDDRENAVALARRAIAADRDDADATSLAGFILAILDRDYTSSLEAVQHALEINPNSATVCWTAGWVHVFGGEPEVALPLAERLQRLSPNYMQVHFVFNTLAIANLILGRFQEAVEFAARSARHYPDLDVTYWILIPAYSHTGRIEEAEKTVGKLLELQPEACISGFRQQLPFKNPEHLQILLEGFEMAGLPQ
jgi:adenylate cyclase